jgi:hypothetical protein
MYFLVELLCRIPVEIPSGKFSLANSTPYPGGGVTATETVKAIPFKCTLSPDFDNLYFRPVYEEICKEVIMLLVSRPLVRKRALVRLCFFGNILILI